MNPTIEITIDNIKSPDFKLGELYTVILYFKDNQGNYLQDERLPHGNRQTVVIDSLPFSLGFEIKGTDFTLFDIQLVVVITKGEFTESGSQQTDFIVKSSEEELLVLNYEIQC